MSKIVKGTYAKNHGTHKKGDVVDFAESTLKALQAHGILEGAAKQSKGNKAKTDK